MKILSNKQSQKIIFTVDVEGPRGTEPIKYQIWGETNSGEQYGIGRLIEELDKRNVKGLFFVDFAESVDNKEEKIAEVAKFIDSKGHNVGVHLHPHHMHDPQRHFLWQYSEQEQKQMIKTCTDLYEKALGEKPLSFRAGKYGANYETLNILDEFGYKYDFSEFYGQKWCGLSPALNRVLPRKYRNIIEFPVTVFKSFDFLGLYKRFDKLDFNITPSELHHVLNEYNKKDNSVIITLFAHSFSLLDFIDKPDDPIPIERRIKRLNSILDYVEKSSELEFIAENELDKVTAREVEDTEADIAKNNWLMSIWYLFLRALSICKHNNAAKVLVLVYTLVLIAIILSLIVFIMR